MRKLSLADANARISELVDQAEHHGQRVVILRHGKPATAIVPVEVALPKRKSRPRMTRAQVEQSIHALYIAEFGACDPESSLDHNYARFRATLTPSNVVFRIARRTECLRANGMTVQRDSCGGNLSEYWKNLTTGQLRNVGTGQCLERVGATEARLVSCRSDAEALTASTTTHIHPYGYIFVEDVDGEGVLCLSGDGNAFEQCRFELKSDQNFATTPVVFFEAEDASRTGTRIVEGRGASRDKYVDFDNGGQQSIEWTISRPRQQSGDEIGTAQIVISYQNGAANRPLWLEVNGMRRPEAIDFPNTGGWTDWQQKVVFVSLPDGESTLRLTADSMGPNIDFISVHPHDQSGL